jgi:DNA-binding CsgD family transcriptional regulator
MEYISALEASEKWDVSLRQVQRLLCENRIPRAKKYGRMWMIPADENKPTDLRKEKKLPDKSLYADLLEIIEATTVPMPRKNPDAIMNNIKEERQRLQYECELSYLRGDFERTLCCYQRTDGDDAARLRASSVAIAASISLGDYHLYTEIEAYLISCVKTDKGRGIAAISELALATAAVSVIVPDIAPEWLKCGDFGDLPVHARHDALYKRAKYFQCVNNYEAMLAVAQTVLTFYTQKHGITFTQIYLYLACATACHSLGRDEEARRWLFDAMSIALPHGFITPFAENVTALGGLTEHCLKQCFPDYYDAVIGQWKLSWRNWIAFHNRFTKDNITLMLSLREYHIAGLVARRVPYAKIAELNHISVGRLKNIILEIYSKLFVTGRDELSEYIL